MARAANLGLRNGKLSVARSGSALAADSATLTDANIPPISAISCAGLDTILVGAEFAGGTGPTLTVEALVYDADAADGSRWKYMSAGVAYEGTPTVGDTGALDGTKLVELPVFGAAQVFLRIKAVANAAGVTAWSVLTMPGRARNVASMNRS